MCGIAGIVTQDNHSAEPQVARMLAALHHRGPDAAAHVTCDRVVLGHTRLAIVDPAGGAQPRRSHDGHWWLTFNGQIFNHRALRRELGPLPFATNSDTETLLEALAHWGLDALPRLDGFFAFAAYHLPTRRLYLVRDRFGVKPLYWTRRAHSLWFASEARALIAAGAPVSPRREVLAHLLRHRWANGPTTVLEGIELLEPGRIITIDTETLGQREHVWGGPLDFVDPALANELERTPRAAIVLRLDAVLAAAVQSRMLADTPVATLCSGGLDSTLVSVYARRHAEHALPSYCATVPSQPAWDEGGWAGAAADALDLRLRRVVLDQQMWRRQLVAAVQHFGQPLVHESSVAFAAIAERARADGVRVLIGGEAADELFGGYESRHLAERARFDAAPVPVREDHDPWDAILEPGQFPPAVAHDQEVQRACLRAYGHHDGARAALEAALAADLSLFLSHGLHRLDANGMQAGVEIREPFLSPDVVRLALNLPLEMRLKPRLKGVLVELAGRHLTQALVERPKNGFSFDGYALMEQHADHAFLLHGRLRELLACGQARWRGALARFSSRARFRLYTAEIWARLMLGDATPVEIAAALWRQPEGRSAA